MLYYFLAFDLYCYGRQGNNKFLLYVPDSPRLKLRFSIKNLRHESALFNHYYIFTFGECNDRVCTKRLNLLLSNY